MAYRGAGAFTRTTGVGASAALSVALHVLLIAAAIIKTAPRLLEPREIPDVFAQFLAPVDRQGSQDAQREQLKFVALGEIEAPIRGSRLVRAKDVVRVPDRQVSGLDLQTAQATMVAAGQDSVFTLIEVDSAATRYSWSAAPAYPAAMLEAKKEGYVKAQWVVDEGGYADTISFKLIDWTGDEFAKAVRDALPFMRFSPAKVGAQVVRQIVEQEFTFRINTVIAGARVPKKP